MRLSRLNGATNSVHPMHRVVARRINDYFSQEKKAIEAFIQKSLISFLDDVFIELTNGIAWPKDKIRVILLPKTQQIQILELIYTKINVEVITETEDEDDFSSIDVRDDVTQEFRDITWVFDDAYKEYKKNIDLEHLYANFLKESSDSQGKEIMFPFFKESLEKSKKSDFEYSKIILEKLFTDKTLWSTHPQELSDH